MFKSKKLPFVIAVILLVGGSFFFQPVRTYATTLFFYAPVNSQNAVATSSPVLMRPGLATSTVSIDANVAGPGRSLDSITLLFQMTATTTASPTVAYRIQDSIDGIDWYTRFNTLSANASTTVLTGTAADYRITYASSTLMHTDATSFGTTTMQRQSIQIPVNTRYTRLVFYTPPGGGQSAIYTRLIGQAEY